MYDIGWIQRNSYYNSSSLSGVINTLCSYCDGVDITGLAIAALATGVVYIFITMEGGEKQKRRKRRNYEFEYGHDSYYQGINVFIIDDLYWDQYF